MRNGPEGSRASYLPDGYAFRDEDEHFAVLRREDGSEEAAFGAKGMDLLGSSQF